MKCPVCQQEVNKLLDKCNLGIGICSKCCFNISSGQPEFINYLKKNVKLTKEEILLKCSQCNPLR